MKLTAKQERMVREFIRDTDESADALPSAAQKRVKNDLRQRLKRELSAFGDEVPRDDQVAAILQRCRVPELSVVEKAPAAVGGVPEAQPARSTPTPLCKNVEPAVATDDERIWAGVCAAWADRLGVETVVVRAAFVLVGLVAPPVAFLAYFGGYVELAARSKEPVVPSAESGVLFLRGLATAVQVLALFLAGYFLPRIVIELSTRFLPELTVRLGAWGWYQGVEWTAFWFVLFLAVPMRLTASLPLRHDWDKTLGLLTRLVVALYVVLISFGIASGLTGAAIAIIEFLTR